MSSTPNIPSEARLPDSISVNAVGDQPSLNDTLGFRPYVKAISEFLKSERTHPPLTLSIEGPWGSGKSSFMIQLQQELQGSTAEEPLSGQRNRPGNYTVFYNAWRQDKDDAMWASFALSVTNQLRQQQGWVTKLLASLGLFLKRIRGTGGWLRVIAAVVIWVLIVGVALWIGWFSWTHSPKQTEEFVKKFVKSDSTSKAQTSAFTVWLLSKGWLGGCIAILSGAWAYIHKIAGAALHIELEHYLTSPDYKGHVSFIESFHDDFKKFLDAYVGRKRVYIFIDDLDRCDVPKAAELMQAINLLIGDDSRLVFILGMDREKVAAGIAQKYKDLLCFLPEYAKKPDDITPADGLYFGYSYLEKFIQLTFRVPSLYGEKAVSGYLDSLAETSDIESSVKASRSFCGAIASKLWGRVQDPADIWADLLNEKYEAEILEDEKEVNWERVETKGDSERIRHIVSMVSPLFENNPRRLKQFLNAYRLAIYLASGQGLLDRKAQRSSATHEQLGKFVALMMRCPDLLPILQKDPKFFENVNFNVFDNPLTKPRWLKQQGVMDLWYYGMREESTPFDMELYSLRKLDVKKLLTIVPLAPPPPDKTTATLAENELLLPKILEQLNEIGETYERIRRDEKFGNPRTKQMTSAVALAYPILSDCPEWLIQEIFLSLSLSNSPGLRLIALILVRVRPKAAYYRFVRECLSLENSNSWFEHYQ